jgi:hypothetical protein
MRHRLFFQIVDQVTVGNPYFQQKVNCAGQIVFSPLHKCTVAMKMLANDCSADSLDDYLRIGESTVLETEEICDNHHISVWCRMAQATIRRGGAAYFTTQ